MRGHDLNMSLFERLVDTHLFVTLKVRDACMHTYINTYINTYIH
jgi:hypothetical protein